MATLYWISTASTDPSVGANWSNGSAPVNGDDVFLVAVPGSVLANIAAFNHSAVTLTSLTVSQTFPQTVGNAGTNGYWQISATTLNIGTPGSGSSNVGSGRVKIDLGSVTSTINVFATSFSSTDAGYEPVRLKGTSASNVLNLMGGTVGVATNQPGETSTLATLNVSGNQSTCRCGTGVTLTAVNVAAGGNLTVNSAVAGTLSVSSSSTVTTYGTGTIATLSSAGTVIASSTGTITTFNLYPSGTADFSQNPAARTVSTLNHYQNATLKVSPANPAHVTVTTRNFVACGTIATS